MQGYSAARAAYLLAARGQNSVVIDAITGSKLDVAEQTVELDMLTDGTVHTHPWTRQVGDLATLANVQQLADLLVEGSVAAPAGSPRHGGRDRTRLFTVVAGAGTGKTWLVKQLLYRLIAKCSGDDPVGFIPWCIPVQAFAFLMDSRGEGARSELEHQHHGDLVEWFAAAKLGDEPTTRDLLMDAYHSRRLVLILDGLDEAPSHKPLIQAFLCGQFLLTGTRAVVTSRPEGIDAATFHFHGFAQFEIKPYTDAQQRSVLKKQLPDTGERSPGCFMRNLLDYMEAKREFDRLYNDRVPADEQARLEGLSRPDLKLRQTVTTQVKSRLRFKPKSKSERVQTADELLGVALASQPGVFAKLRAVASEVGLEAFEEEHDLEVAGMVGLLLGPVKTKERIEEKAAKNADDSHPFSKIIDVLRCKYVCETGFQMLELVGALEAQPDVRIVRLKNFFADPDEINFRRFQATVLFKIGTALSHCIEVQIHLKDIYLFREGREDLAYKPYRYFREIFRETSDSGGWVQLLDSRLEAWSGFLSVPVVMSMFVVVLATFNFEDPRVEQLPANKADLYYHGLRAIVEQKLRQLVTGGAEPQGSLEGGPSSRTMGLNVAVSAVYRQWVDSVVSLLALLAHTKQHGSDGSVRAQVQRQFTLEDMRTIFAASVRGGGLGKRDTPMQLLEQLLFKFDPEDSNRVPTLKIIEYGGQGQAQQILFQSAHLSLQEAWSSQHLLLDAGAFGRAFGTRDRALAYLLDETNHNSVTLLPSAVLEKLQAVLCSGSGELVLRGDASDVTDMGLGHIARLGSLTSLNLHDCGEITDAGLAHLAMLQQLASLDLRHCGRITDVGLAHLAKLQQLASLDLSDCGEITDAGLAHLAKLPQLASLDLGLCGKITDAGLMHLAKLQQLASLNLGHCGKITNAGLAHLAKLQQLASLDLEYCGRITDAGRALVPCLRT